MAIFSIRTNRKVTGTVPTPFFGFKTHRVRGDENQQLNSNPSYVQIEMILPHVSLLWAGRTPSLNRHQKGKPRDSRYTKKLHRR
ncbi:hypothetical protein TNCV_4607261 [Trichonephila clavipes]|nr:hypothetical protein TNCV_4607261 [Trichonephila clavipes]